jgi:hypothetical protein
MTHKLIRLGTKVKILNGGPELWVVKVLKRTAPDAIYLIARDGEPANHQWRRASELEAVEAADESRS